MKTNRRGFLSALVAAAGVAAVGPVGKAEAAPSTVDQAVAFPHSSGHGMREIGLQQRPVRTPMDLRIMCWDCQWVSPWMHESVSTAGVFAPFETHLAAVHPGAAIDHEMQWRPSQWQWPEYLESVEEQVRALTPTDQIEKARTEGYQRGYDVATARAESRAMVQPITFEAMAADCAARGCRLAAKRDSNKPHAWAVTHYEHDGSLESPWTRKAFPDIDAFPREAIDTWRRSLHEDA